MNYRTIIAFMGKKQLDKYKHTSEWILAKEAKATEWPPEMVELKKLSNPIHAAGFEYIFGYEESDNSMEKLPSQRAMPGEDWLYWYNPKHDALFYVYGSSAVNDKETQDKAMKYIEGFLGNNPAAQFKKIKLKDL